MTKAVILGGNFDSIIARQKSQNKIQLGELLVAETNKADNKKLKHILQVYDLLYGSQLDKSLLELVAGLKLELPKSEFLEPELRSYNLIVLKPLLTVENSKARTAKELPGFFTELRKITANDFDFLKTKDLVFGRLRSGSEVLDVPIALNSEKVLTHHMLIAGSTGKGKSMLMKTLLWHLLNTNTSALVIDPHDEYYGRNSLGLKDHPNGRVEYYTQNPLKTKNYQRLVININSLRPEHFFFMNLTAAQKEAMITYYKHFNNQWIKALLLENSIENNQNMSFKRQIQDITIAVLKRKLSAILDIRTSNNALICEGVFKENIAEAAINNMVKNLSQSKIVVIDSSRLNNDQELLIASLIASKVFKRHKHLKDSGNLKQNPVVVFVLEEAPRVLNNPETVFSSIAREGRKFKIGLIAITQTPSSIPRDILTNMNTKVILGVSSNTERQALINSASQDLSKDDKTIASLDIGEALITSSFSPIAIPIKTFLFDDLVELEISKKNKYIKNFEKSEKALVGFETD